MKSFECKKKLMIACLLVISILAWMLIPIQSAKAFKGTPISQEISLTQFIEAKNTDLENVEGPINYELIASREGSPMPENAEGDTLNFSLEREGEFVIGTMTFDEPKEYKYTLRARKDQKRGYHPDEMEYEITIDIGTLGSGPNLTLEMFVRDTEGNKYANMEFHHVYKPLPVDTKDSIADPEMEIKKRIEGNPPTPETFTFALQASEPDMPMPVNSVNGRKEVTVVGSGTAKFGNIIYPYAGTFIYTVSEVKGNGPYTYDEGVYTVTDVVTDEDGQLVFTRMIKNNSEGNLLEMEFVNKYNEEASVSTLMTTLMTGDAMQIGMILLLMGASFGIAAFIKKRTKKQ